MPRPPIARRARSIASARARAVAFACAALAVGGCRGAANGPEPARGDAPREAVAVVTRCEAPARAESTGVRTRLDVPYATAGGDTLRLDLAVPAGPGPHPVVVLLHGGGWEGGDRGAMREEMRLLAARGYAAATVSYRLTQAPRNVFPAAVRDVRCAVRWLRAAAPTLALDGGRIGALGFSAGAYLASMLGVAADLPALDAPGAGGGGGAPGACLAPAGQPADAAAAASPAVQAVVSVAGPQDLRVDGPYTHEQARLVTNFLGAFPGDAPALAARASPIVHVSARAAPFLLVHGTRDDLVPVAHARRMRDALHAAGSPATVLELRGRGHEFPALDGRDAPAVGCTTMAFLDRWLRGR